MVRVASAGGRGQDLRARSVDVADGDRREIAPRVGARLGADARIAEPDGSPERVGDVAADRDPHLAASDEHAARQVRRVARMAGRVLRSRRDDRGRPVGLPIRFRARTARPSASALVADSPRMSELATASAPASAAFWRIGVR